jgi:hypothetical protein
MNTFYRCARYHCGLSLLLLILAASLTPVLAQEPQFSLRFYGNGINDIDRVKIPLDHRVSAVNMSGDFTIEFFMRANLEENTTGVCTTGEAGWTNGNILIDRDVFGAGDYGDYGLSLFGQDGVIAFGVSRGETGDTICGETNVADGLWHHIAVTRDSATGLLQLFVDGVLDGSTTGPMGDISYRQGRSTSWPNDAYLVIGAEKHDYSSDYPSFSGWLDELRISDIVRYDADFDPPTAPFETDDHTLALYHFDEGEGDVIIDSSATGSDGELRYGGTPAGPEWVEESPFLLSEADDTGTAN